MEFNLVDYDLCNNVLKTGNWMLRKSNAGIWKEAFCIDNDKYKLSSDRQAICFNKLENEYGTYKITLTVHRTADDNEISVYVGRRNLIRHKTHVENDESLKIEFYTHLSPYIPALTYRRDEDKNIYVSIIAKNIVIDNIVSEKADIKTIFIAGDSTLTDQNALTPYYPICSCAGWAQDLSFFAKDMAVCNYAHSGLTTNCFRDDGHWDILKEQFKPGDFFIIQFGHNDQKRRNLLPYEGYKNNLIWYVNEVRKMNGFPIICSPISRVPIVDEVETYSLLLDYSKACEEVAREMNVPFIDLHSFTFDKWTSIDKDYVKNYFIPGDITHTNDYGAIMIAHYVATNLLKINEIKDYIVCRETDYFNPESDTKDFPTEVFESSPFDIDMPFMDVDKVKNYDLCQDAFKKGLMDPCVMHIHPTDVMPRAQLLMILLRALRLNGTRPYVGNFKDISKYEWDSSYVQTCINENMIDESTVTTDCFRPNDALTYGEFSSFCIRGLGFNLGLNEAYNKAIEMKLIPDTVNINDYITREYVYEGLAKIMDYANNKSKNMPTDTEMHPVH